MITIGTIYYLLMCFVVTKLYYKTPLYRKTFYIIGYTLIFFVYIIAFISDPGLTYLLKKEKFEKDEESQLDNINNEIDICDSCKVERTIYSFHCKECDTCVEKIDHHCLFFSKCIAEKNKQLFYAVIGSAGMGIFMNYGEAFKHLV